MLLDTTHCKQAVNRILKKFQFFSKLFSMLMLLEMVSSHFEREIAQVFQELIFLF